MIEAKPLLVPNKLDNSDLELIGEKIVLAYRACDEFMASNAVTSGYLVGMEQRSRLISPFVEYALSQMGHNFFSEIKPNKANNCHHTRIYKNGLTLTAHFLGKRSEEYQINAEICCESRISIIAE